MHGYVMLTPDASSVLSYSMCVTYQLSLAFVISLHHTGAILVIDFTLQEYQTEKNKCGF